MDIVFAVWEMLSTVSFLIVAALAIIIFAVALWYGVE